MTKKLLVLLLALLPVLSNAQQRTFAGEVLEADGGTPIEYATIVIKTTGQWAVADSKGKFSIANVSAGNVEISVSCLGYITEERVVEIKPDMKLFKIALKKDNLSIDGAVITARENTSAGSTSRTMDRTALDHVQMLNITDISALLPGGVTQNANLTSSQQFNIRAASGENGNASFGTAVEVDGVRLSSNASFSQTAGVSTNKLASSNVESVEVISGVASVEYGDIGSGIVKINTQKGKTPYMVTLTTNPNTKQASFSKGFGLGNTAAGNSKGILNVSLEYAKSVSDNRSPYTSYDRKNYNLSYSNLFKSGVFENNPLRVTVGIGGNFGGYNSEADPDLLKGTFEKSRDNSFRANFNADWLLSKSWITKVEVKGSVVYDDKFTRTKSLYTSAAGTAALHGTEEGYYIAQSYSNPDQPVVMIPRGTWYNTMTTDDKPLSYRLSLKATWARNFGKVNSNLKVGADWNADKNFGKGLGTEDQATAPTYRKYDYSQEPFMNNLAAYAEETAAIPFGKTRLNLTAGLRAEFTMINGSEYGNVSSLSPRFNARYTIIDNRKENLLSHLAFRAGWGVAVKQPSFAILYPIPSYRDITAFYPTSNSQAESFYGFYIMPRKNIYNPDLVWQRQNQLEAGMDFTISGNKISIAAYKSSTEKSYYQATGYDRFTYNYTDQTDFALCPIPADNRVFDIDRTTGKVTVSDKTGSLPSQIVAGKTKESLVPNNYAANSNADISRWGLEWIIDFKKIRPLNTTIRLDGSFYSYKSMNTEDMIAYSPYNTQMTDGSPYSYIGYYLGNKALSNGCETKTVRANITVTTHIPKARLILSAKLEASLMKYSRSLSEGDGRTYAVGSSSDLLPSGGISYMDNRTFAVTYPKYYATYDDPTNMRDFYSAFMDAYTNDKALFNDLSRLVYKANYAYMFAKDYISPFCSANFSVTKEIGDMASISFYANNFFVSQGQVYSTKYKKHSSVTGYVPPFYYGLTARIKF